MRATRRRRHAGGTLCPVWVALALTPTGVMLSVVAMLAVAHLLGLPVAGTGGDTIVGGTRTAQLNDLVMVLGVGAACAFASPVFALVHAIRAQREGRHRAGLGVGLAGLAVGVVLALPLIWNPLMTVALTP